MNGQCWSKLEVGCLLLLGLGTVGLGFYHLEAYPAPWFDEGWYLQIPRNLVLYGQYAPLSAEGFRAADTVLSVAPTLYLPVAAAFKLAGIGFFQARVVMLGYLLGASVAFYLAARRAYGPTVAVVALYLFIFRLEDDPFTSTFYLGRQVMGEVPALGFLLAGGLLWFRALETPVRRGGWLVGAGLLLGLAAITKLQFILLILPTLLATGLIAQLYWRERTFGPAVIAAGICLGSLALWYGVLRFIMGAENFTVLLRDLASASSPQVRVSSWVAMVHGAKFLLRSTFLIVGGPGLLYALGVGIRRKRPNVPALFLFCFVGVALGWYLLASVGWARYAYPFLAVSNLFIARLLVDLGDGFRFARREAGTPASAGWARALAVLVMVVVLPWGNFRLLARDLVAPDRSLEQFNAYLQAHVPAGAVIETWEWEVAFLDTTHRYHFPPTPLLNTLIAQANLGVTGDVVDYDFLAAQPDYVVVGRFAQWTNLYPMAILAARGRPVVTIGIYVLYEVMDS
jgi:4-amino-4-deoxy-L-arabinose transferase-like glycosyltransferase